MGRLLFLIAIVAVIYLLFRSYRKKLSQQDEHVVENMVRCAHCGMHVPKNESVQANGQFFCSAEHRDASKE